MADNVVITAGSGTTIHADEYTHTTLGAGKTQLVKLVDGTLDAEAAIAADIGVKANALRVAPANNITDATYIGDIKFGEAEPNSAAIKTAVEAIQAAVEIMDDWDDSNYANVNLNLAGTDVTAGAGAVAAGTPRVTLASDDPAVVDLAAIEVLLTTIDADTDAIKTAVELIDNSVDGAYLNVNANIAGTDMVGGAGAVAAGVQRVTLASDDPAVVDLAAIEVLLGTIDTDTGNMVTALQIMDDWDNAASDGASVSGDTAHDSADAGEPVKIGGKAYNQDGTAPGTAVSEGDRANFICDVYGRQYVSQHHPNLWKATDNQSSAQTNTALKAAPGAGLSLYITDIIISNGATAGNVKLVEDTGGTPVDILEVMYFAANGGAVINLQTPIKVTANKDVGYTSVTVTTHSVTLSGYIAP